jgi:hypothetical protein
VSQLLGTIASSPISDESTIKSFTRPSKGRSDDEAAAIPAATEQIGEIAGGGVHRASVAEPPNDENV